MLVILTHDIDWSRRGPSIHHVLDRLNRFCFNDRLYFFSLRENIYDGISMIMEYEYRQGVKSTFFFRPIYDDNTTAELYSDIISELRRGGWEIGLHANNSTIDNIAKEKIIIENLYAEKIKSLRVHYLKISINIIPMLKTINIRFDSSLTLSRYKFTEESGNCINFDGVIELPITIMDTYMFTYWGIDPSNAYTKLVEMLKILYARGVKISTILWHSNSVRMIGGRDYLKFIEEIWRYEWIIPMRVIDVENYIAMCKSYNV